MSKQRVRYYAGNLTLISCNYFWKGFLM